MGKASLRVTSSGGEARARCGWRTVVGSSHPLCLAHHEMWDMFQMTDWAVPDTLALAHRRRREVIAEIKRLLVLRDLIGDWAPDHRARYLVLCEEERILIKRLRELSLAPTPVLV